MTISNMTTADRLAEKLKTGPMSDFFTEDDLLDLCKKAIEKAFFTNITDAYSRKTELAPIVKLAEEAMKTKVKEFVDEKFSQIINDEKFQEKMGQLMIASLGGVLMDSLRDNWTKQFFDDLSTHSSYIANIVKRHL